MFASSDIFNVSEIKDESYVDKLENEEIHVYVDKDMELLVSQSGIHQSIVKEVVEQMIQILTLTWI